jgi:hypothetical protein
MQWDWNEVDGVTTLSAPAGAIQGPLQACLVFGVGRTDETMLTAGITHAVEHLAFHPLETRPYSVNGSVSTVCTRFIVAGEPEDAVEFLRAITINLADLPVDQLDHELKILLVEEHQRAGSQLGHDLSERFGPVGVGLVGWPEHGLKRVGADDLREWCSTWFTTGNAVLWTSGPLPAHLDLSALPAGDAPTHTPTPPSLPPPRSFVAANTSLVSLSVIVDPATGLAPAIEVGERRAFDRLRRRDGLSYGINADQVRLDAGQMLLTLGADGLDGRYTQIFEGLVEVWDELAEHGPTEQEWDHLLRAHRPHADHPHSLMGTLDNDAERHVLGLPFSSRENFWSTVAALTPDDVRRGLQSMAPTLFGVVPNEVGDGAAGWTAYVQWSAEPVVGHTYFPIDGREAGTIVVGSDGVSWVDVDDHHARTVHWDDAVCVFSWDDGTRTVLGPTGMAVVMVPWRWRAGHQFAARVDAALDDGRHIRLGEGETYYLEDPSDPDSVTHLRWLATVVGARHRGEHVDLVIDTDGFFLLFDHVERQSLQARFRHLGRSDRDTLLSGDTRNRWVPQEDIALAVLEKRLRARLHGGRWALTIRLHDESVLYIVLRDRGDDVMAASAFRPMLGPLFQIRAARAWTDAWT